MYMILEIRICGFLFIDFLKPFCSVIYWDRDKLLKNGLDKKWDPEVKKKSLS